MAAEKLGFRDILNGRKQMLGLTNLDISKKCGLCENTIANALGKTSRADLYLRTFIRICKALGLRVFIGTTDAKYIKELKEG